MLVATCIAEEGLDIGAVDVCVFYDQVGSPIRMVQRMGRTARKRTGRVVLLMVPGEEKKDLVPFEVWLQNKKDQEERKKKAKFVAMMGGAISAF